MINSENSIQFPQKYSNKGALCWLNMSQMYHNTSFIQALEVLKVCWNIFGYFQKHSEVFWKNCRKSA